MPESTITYGLWAIVLGAVGLFAKWKYRYDDRMNELEAERTAKTAKASDRSRAA